MKKLAFLLAFLIVGVSSAAPSVVSTTQTSATIEGLECGSKYRFEIRKYTATGELSASADSVEAETKSCPDTQPPSAPQDLAASGQTQSSISLSWSASNDNVGVAGYQLYRNGAKVDTTTARSYSFGSLACGTSYTLAVESEDAAGNRSPASAITAATAACPPPSCPSGAYSAEYFANMTLAGAPVLQRCEAKIDHGWGSGGPGGSVPADRFSSRWTGSFSFAAGTHQFTATADDGIRVWVDGAPLLEAWKDQAPTSYRATRLLTAGEHVVKVEYYENGGGAVARVGWQLSEPTPPPPPPPPPPSDTQPPSVPQGMAYAGKTQTSVSIVWNASTDNVGVAGYHLYRNGIRVASIQSLSYTLTGLTCATGYTFGLEAYDAAGNVSNRGEASGTTSTSPCDAPPADTQPPAAPQGLSLASKTQTSVSLTWSASTDNVGVAGYHAYRDGIRIGSPQSLAYTFGGLTCGTSYTFAVEAYDAAGNVSNRTAATLVGSTGACDAPPPPPPPPPPGPAIGTANLWVDSNGGTCTRSATPVAYLDAAACATFDGAYDAANASTSASTVLVKGGLYPEQTLSGNRASTNRVTFDEAPGENVTVDGYLKVGVNRDSGTIGPDYVILSNFTTNTIPARFENGGFNRYGVYVSPGSSFIRLEKLTAGGVAIAGASDIEVIGGSMGPCRSQSLLDYWGADGTSGPQGNGKQPCDSTRIDADNGQPNRITFDGVDFHDFDYSNECMRQGQPGYVFPPGITPDGCHWRPMYLNGVHNFTLRNSTVRNSVFHPWFTLSGSAQPYGNHDILIENNQFGSPVFWQAGSPGNGKGLEFAYCQNYRGSDVPYRNVTVRFNSFARGTSIGAPGVEPQEFGCQVVNVRVYGNIIGQKAGCGLSTIAWSYNVFTGSAGGTCGTGDVNIGGTTMPFYSVDTRTPTAFDFALTGVSATPDNRVPTSVGCAGRDARGTLRPQTPGFCDAGAFER